MEIVENSRRCVPRVSWWSIGIALRPDVLLAQPFSFSSFFPNRIIPPTHPHSFIHVTKQTVAENGRNPLPFLYLDFWKACDYDQVARMVRHRWVIGHESSLKQFLAEKDKNQNTETVDQAQPVFGSNSQGKEKQDPITASMQRGIFVVKKKATASVVLAVRSPIAFVFFFYISIELILLLLIVSSHTRQGTCTHTQWVSTGVITEEDKNRIGSSERAWIVKFELYR